jgi:hypothetical protein
MLLTAVFVIKARIMCAKCITAINYILQFMCEYFLDPSQECLARMTLKLVNHVHSLTVHDCEDGPLSLAIPHSGSD